MGRTSSVFNTVDFSKSFKPTSTQSFIGPTQPEKNTGLAPEVVAEQKRLAEKYGIQTFDRSGNVTFDGTTTSGTTSKTRSTRYTPKKQITIKSIDQFANIEKNIQAPVTTKQVQSIVPQAEATMELVSDFRQKNLDLASAIQTSRDKYPEQFKDKNTGQTFEYAQLPSSQQPIEQTQQSTGNQRLDQLQAQSRIADDTVYSLERKLNGIDESMFSEANRLRGKLGNANVNVENEAELINLSNRYKALFAERGEVQLQLRSAEGAKDRIDKLMTDAETEEISKPEEERTVSGIIDYNPMEFQGQLNPVYTQPTSPEENAVAQGQAGTIVDPNFSLADVSKDKATDSEFNQGIPTFEALQRGGDVDEISEINSGAQRMEADSQGLLDRPLTQDPTDAALDGLGRTAGSLANFFGQPAIPTAYAEEEPQQQGPEYDERQTQLDQLAESSQEPEYQEDSPVTFGDGYQEGQTEQPQTEIPTLGGDSYYADAPPPQEQQPDGVSGLSGISSFAQPQEPIEQDQFQFAAGQPSDPTSFSNQGAGILRAYDKFRAGGNVFNIEQQESQSGLNVKLSPESKSEFVTMGGGLDGPDAQAPDAGFNKFSAASEIPAADLNQGLEDSLPFTGNQSTQELYLQAAQKLGEQGYLQNKDGVEGFLSPSSFKPMQINGVSRTGQPLYDSKGTEIPQKFFGSDNDIPESQVISNIYARQANDRLENAKQEEYFWNLTRGEASISDALLNPRTTQTYIKGGIKNNEVPKERKEFIESYFGERGISLDEQFGSVKISPKRFTKSQIDAARALGGNINIGNTIGIESLSNDFRKTKDGKPLLADTKPTTAERQEANYRRALLNAATDSPSTQYQITDDGKKEITKVVNNILSSPKYKKNEYFALSYTNADGQKVEDIVARANLEIMYSNVAKSTGIGPTVLPTNKTQPSSSSRGTIDPITGAIIKSNENVTTLDQSIDAYPDAPMSYAPTNTKIGLPPNSAGFILGSAAVLPLLNSASSFAALPSFDFSGRTQTDFSQSAKPRPPTIVTKDVDGNITGYSQGDAGGVVPVITPQTQSNAVISQQGIAVAPIFPSGYTLDENGNPIDAATKQLLTFDANGNPEPLKPIKITADFSKDPLGYIGQQLFQGGQGAAYPVTNIAATVIGAGEGAADGDIIGGIGSKVMGTTALDQTIDAIGAGYTEESGYKPLDLTKGWWKMSGKTGSVDSIRDSERAEAPNALESTSDFLLTGIALAGGVVNQATQRTQSEKDDKGFLPAGTIGAALAATGAGLMLIDQKDNTLFGVKLDDLEYETNYSRAAPEVNKKFEELGQDIKESPAFYAGSILSEVATFIAAPLAGTKAVKAAERGAKTTANVLTTINVLGGGGTLGGGGSIKWKLPFKNTLNAAGLARGGVSLQKPFEIITPAMKVAQTDRILLQPAYGVVEKVAFGGLPKATPIGTPVFTAVSEVTAKGATRGVLASTLAKIGFRGLIGLTPEELSAKIGGDIGLTFEKGMKTPEARIIDKSNNPEAFINQEQLEASILAPGGRIDNVPDIPFGMSEQSWTKVGRVDTGVEPLLTSASSSIKNSVVQKIDNIAIKTGTYTPKQINDLKTSIGVNNDYVIKVKADIDAKIASQIPTPKLIKYKKELDVFFSPVGSSGPRTVPNIEQLDPVYNAVIPSRPGATITNTRTGKAVDQFEEFGFNDSNSVVDQYSLYYKDPTSLPGDNIVIPQTAKGFGPKTQKELDALKKIEDEIAALKAKKTPAEKKLAAERIALDKQLDRMISKETVMLKNLKELKKQGIKNDSSGNINAQIKLLEDEIKNSKKQMAPAYKAWGNQNMKLKSLKSNEQGSTKIIALNKKADKLRTQIAQNPKTENPQDDKMILYHTTETADDPEQALKAIKKDGLKDITGQGIYVSDRKGYGIGGNGGLDTDEVLEFAVNKKGLKILDLEQVYYDSQKTGMRKKFSAYVKNGNEDDIWAFAKSEGYDLVKHVIPNEYVVINPKKLKLQSGISTPSGLPRGFAQTPTTVSPSTDYVTNFLRGGDTLPTMTSIDQTSSIPFGSQSIGITRNSDIPNYTTDFGALPKGVTGKFSNTLEKNILGSTRKTYVDKTSPGVVPFQPKIVTIDTVEDSLKELHRLAVQSGKKVDGRKVGDDMEALIIAFQGVKDAKNITTRNQYMKILKENVDTLPREQFRDQHELFKQVKTVSTDLDTFLAKSPAAEADDLVKEYNDAPAFFQNLQFSSADENTNFMVDRGTGKLSTRKNQKPNFSTSVDFVSGKTATEFDNASNDALVRITFTSDYTGAKNKRWTIKKSDYEKSMKDHSDVMKLYHKGEGTLDIQIISAGSADGRPMGQIVKLDKISTPELNALGLDDGVQDSIDPRFTAYKMIAPENQIKASITRNSFEIKLDAPTMEQYGDVINELGDNVKIGKNEKLFTKTEQVELDNINTILSQIATEKDDMLKLRNSVSLVSEKKGKGAKIDNSYFYGVGTGGKVSMPGIATPLKKAKKKVENGYKLYGKFDYDTMEYLKSTYGSRFNPVLDRKQQLSDRKATGLFTSLLERKAILAQKKDTATAIARNDIIEAEQINIKYLLGETTDTNQKLVQEGLEKGNSGISFLFEGTPVKNSSDLAATLQHANRLNKDFIMFELAKYNGATVKDLKNEYGSLYSALNLSTARKSENILAPTDKQFSTMLKKLEGDELIERKGDKYYLITKKGKPSQLSENSLVQANNLTPEKIHNLLSKTNTKYNPKGSVDQTAFIGPPKNNPAVNVENAIKNELGENFNKLDQFLVSNDFYRADDINMIKTTVYSVNSNPSNIAASTDAGKIVREKGSTKFIKQKSEIVKKGQKYTAKGGKFPYPENIAPEVRVFDSAADGLITELLENEVSGRRLKSLDTGKMYQTQALQKYYLAKNKVNDLTEQLYLAQHDKKSKWNEPVDVIQTKLSKANEDLDATILLHKTSIVSDNRAVQSFNYDDVYRTIQSITYSRNKKAQLQLETEQLEKQLVKNTNTKEAAEAKSKLYDSLSQTSKSNETPGSYIDASGNPIQSPQILKSNFDKTIAQIKKEGYVVTAIYDPNNGSVRKTWKVSVPLSDKGKRGAAARYQTMGETQRGVKPNWRLVSDPSKDKKIVGYEEMLNASQEELIKANPTFVDIDSYNYRSLSLNAGKEKIDNNLEEVNSLLKVLKAEGFDEKAKPPFTKSVNSSAKIKKLENDLKKSYGYDAELAKQGSPELAMKNVDKKYKKRVELILADISELKKSPSTDMPVSSWSEIINSRDTQFKLNESKVVTKEDVNDFNTGLQQTDELSGRAFSDVDTIIESHLDPQTGKVNIEDLKTSIRTKDNQGRDYRGSIYDADPEDSFSISGKTDYQGKKAAKIGVRTEEQAAKNKEHWMDQALEDNTTIDPEKMPLMYGELKKMQKNLTASKLSIGEEIKMNNINLINAKAYSKKTDEIVQSMGGKLLKNDKVNGKKERWVGAKSMQYVGKSPRDTDSIDNLRVLFADSDANTAQFERAVTSRNKIYNVINESVESEDNIMDNLWPTAERTYASTDDKLHKTIKPILNLTEKQNYYETNASKVLKRLIKGDTTVQNGKVVKFNPDSSLSTVDPDDVIRLSNKVETKLPTLELKKVDKVKTQLDKEWQIWLSDETDRYKDKLIKDTKIKSRSGYKNDYGKETLYARKTSKWRTDRNFKQHDKTPENDMVMADNLDSLVQELKAKFDGYVPTDKEAKNKYFLEKKKAIGQNLELLDNNTTILKNTAESLNDERNKLVTNNIWLNKIKGSIANDDTMSKGMKKWVVLESDENIILRNKYDFESQKLLNKNTDVQKLIADKKNLMNKETAAINLKTGKLKNANNLDNKSIYKIQTITKIKIAPGLSEQKLADALVIVSQWPGKGRGVETMTPNVKEALGVLTKNNKKATTKIATYMSKEDMTRSILPSEKKFGTGNFYPTEPAPKATLEELVLASQSKKESLGLIPEEELGTSAFNFMSIIKNKELPLSLRLGAIVPTGKNTLGRGLRVIRRGILEPNDIEIGPRGISKDNPNLKNAEYQAIHGDILANDGKGIQTFDLVKGGIAVNDVEEKLIKNTIIKPNKLESLVKFWSTNNNPKVTDVRVVNTALKSDYQKMLKNLDIESPPNSVTQIIEKTGKITQTDKDYLTYFAKAQGDIDTSTTKMNITLSKKSIQAEKKRLIAEKNDIQSSYTTVLLKKQQSGGKIDMADMNKMTTLINEKQSQLNVMDILEKAKTGRTGQVRMDNPIINTMMDGNPTRYLDENEFSGFGPFIKNWAKTNNQIVTKKQTLSKVHDKYITSRQNIFSSNILSETKTQVKAISKSKKLTKEQKKSAVNYVLMKQEEKKIQYLTIARNNINDKYDKSITKIEKFGDVVESNPAKNSFVFDQEIDNSKVLKAKLIEADNEINLLKVNANNYEGEMYSEAIGALKDKFKFKTSYEKSIPSQIGGKGSGGMNPETGVTLDPFDKMAKPFTGSEPELGYTLPLKQELESANPVIYDMISTGGTTPTKRVKKYPGVADSLPKGFSSDGKNWFDVKTSTPSPSPDMGIPGRSQVLTTVEQIEKKMDDLSTMKAAFQEQYLGPNLTKTKPLIKKKKPSKLYPLGQSAVGLGVGSFGGANVAYGEEYGKVIQPPFNTPTPPFNTPNPFAIPQSTISPISKNRLITEATKPSLNTNYFMDTNVGIKPMSLVGTKINTDVRIKQSLLPIQRQDFILGAKQIPIQRTRVIASTKLDTVVKQKLFAPTILKPLLFAPTKVAERPILRPRVPFIPPVPFWLSSTKKKRKPKKPKKGKKKTIVWAVPDVWFGRYDPEEYKVIGKNAKTPKKFQTGNFGFDSEFA